SKPTRYAPYGILKLMKIPVRPWQHLTIDFVIGLPEDSEFNAILMVINKKSCLRPVHPDAQDVQDAQDENSRSGRQSSVLVRQDALAVCVRAWDATHSTSAPGTQYTGAAGALPPGMQDMCASAPGMQS
ncbi:hypothetical protein BGX38DRAFT_1106999, partial [Terfezia claveryi]